MIFCILCAPMMEDEIQNLSRSQRCVLAALAIGALVVFSVALPHLHVDRMQEGVYLGNPYLMLANHQPRISKAIDPFGENGPQVVFPASALLLQTGSLRAVRYLQFSYSLLGILLLGCFFFKSLKRTSSFLEMMVFGIILLAVWLSIPLAMTYPAQCNGMGAGFVCFLLGLYISPRHPLRGMAMFGLAYACKTQFLGMLPGILLYKAFLDRTEQPFGKHVGNLVLQTFIYFLPACVVIPGIGVALHLFTSRQELINYAMNGPHEIWIQAAYHIPRLFHAMPAAHQARVDSIKSSEFAGYGPLAWSHILLSSGFCLVLAGRSIWDRCKGMPVDPAQGLLGLAGLFYWFHFFFVYRYPYWYNVFALILLNPFLAAVLVREACERFDRRKVLGLAALVFAMLLVRSVWKLPGWGAKPEGNALTPYQWMRSPGSSL